MATRFWITNSPAPYTPSTKRGTWNNSAATTICLLGRAPAGASAQAAVAETATTTTNVLLARWVSPPAQKPGTLSGTVAWITGRSQSSSSAAMVVRAHMYVTAGDSTTVRGTLLANYTGGTAFPTTANGGGTPGTAITSVALQTGDRIVIEFGYQATNTVSTSHTGRLYYGATGTTDLASGATTVTTDPGWVEFSGADGFFTRTVAKVWTGSAWTQKPVKVWTGSAWTAKPMKSWSGTTWL